MAEKRAASMDSEEYQVALKMYSAGKSIGEISRVTGKSRSTIQHWRDRDCWGAAAPNSIICHNCGLLVGEMMNTDDEKKQVVCPGCGMAVIPRYSPVLAAMKPFPLEDEADLEQHNMTATREVRRLKAPMTDAEKMDLATKLCDLVLEVKAVAGQVEAEKMNHKNRIKVLEGTQDSLVAQAQDMSDAYKEGKVPRDVPCLFIKDFDLGIGILIRLDNCESVLERRLSQDEMQGRLFEPEEVEPEPQEAEERFLAG